MLNYNIFANNIMKRTFVKKVNAAKGQSGEGSIEVET